MHSRVRVESADVERSGSMAQWDSANVTSRVVGS
ncbi:hypothetical protein SAMN04489867_3508 [Pedococcus dokdonensis]|uniref:Uncharacterized protein n=1 Tax=Pedococcus dokdonensis TaxID=443156 RepID=A0A1H0UVA3_9MICO|nr:hypothetical protein SAMN04489867_3508 [Pedococcus dokdonensis]